MKTLTTALALTASFATVGTAQTTPTASAAAMFGVRERVLQLSLSPDGSHIAYIQPTAGQGSAVFTVAIGTGETPKRILSASGSPERLEWCRWSSNTRLVCAIYAVQRIAHLIASSSQLISVNAGGGDQKILTRNEGENAAYHSFYGGSVIDWLPEENGAILMQQVYVPESRAGTLIEKRLEGLGVDRVDTTTLATKHIVSPLVEAGEFISDGHGNVRILGTVRRNTDGYYGKIINYQYRLPDKNGWKTLSQYDSLSKEGFNPYAVDGVLNVVYGLQKLDGRLAMYKRSLDGLDKQDLVFAHPQVDVDGLIRIGKTQRVIGVSYATDRPQGVYFDTAISALRTKLSKALGNPQKLDILDSSVDEQKLLLFVGGDTSAGKYYLFDRAAKKLGELLPSRPELTDIRLAEVKPVSVKAADGSMIPAYLTLPPGSNGKNLPAIVLPHGGPGARDYGGFDWLSQFYANQGFAVLQPNFRGSTGYGDNWLKVNGIQSWRTAIGDVTESGRWLVAQGIADPKKLGILGWSYGGYAALQSGVVAPDLFKAIVAIAPVTDFDLLRRQDRFWTNKFLTRDYVGSGAHLEEGSPAQNASAIKAPVLMFHGTLDLNVDYDHAKLMESKLKGAGKKVELVTFEKLDHYLEDGAVRTQMLQRSADFLRSSMGISAP